MSNRKAWGSLLSAAFAAAFATSAASAAVVFTDGFEDGDRDNNGTAEAAVNNPSDIGIPWYGVGGTSSVTHVAVDDSAGIGTGNALQIFNTASNNRPHVGLFPEVTLADGEKLILGFDMRVVSSSAATSDRSFRFGLYHGGATTITGDLGSTATEPNDDLGYNARVDVGADASNSTSMDVTRDDSAGGTLIAGTTTGLSISSTNAANQLTDTLKHHFQLTLERSGSSLLITLQQDSNPAITGTDATPIGFAFNEVMIGPRSNSAMDLRFDNFQLQHIAIPEPATLGLTGLGALALGLRRRTK